MWKEQHDAGNTPPGWIAEFLVTMQISRQIRLGNIDWQLGPMVSEVELLSRPELQAAFLVSLAPVRIFSASRGPAWPRILTSMPRTFW
jgi:hypothetical protein